MEKEPHIRQIPTPDKGNQKSEAVGGKPEAGGRKAEVRNQKSEVRNLKAESKGGPDSLPGRKPFDEAGSPALECEEPAGEDASSGGPVEIPIEDSIDLHTFSPKEVRAVLEEYLLEAHKKGFLEVRVIHGRGIGVQREIVRSVLSKHPLVASFRDARPEAGGWGATWAVLKRG